MCKPRCKLAGFNFEERRIDSEMSKITNDCLIRSGTGCFLALFTHMAIVGVKGLILVCMGVFVCSDSHTVKSQLLSAAISVGRSRGSHIDKLHTQLVDSALHVSCHTTSVVLVIAAHHLPGS